MCNCGHPEDAHHQIRVFDDDEVEYKTMYCEAQIILDNYTYPCRCEEYSAA